MIWAAFLEQRADEVSARATACGLQAVVPRNEVAHAQAESLEDRAVELRKVAHQHSDLSMIVSAKVREEVPPRCRRCRSQGPCEVAREALADLSKHPDFSPNWVG